MTIKEVVSEAFVSASVSDGVETSSLFCGIVPGDEVGLATGVVGAGRGVGFVFGAGLVGIV